MRAGQFDTQDATNGWGGELALYPGAAVRPRQIADRQGAAPLCEFNRSTQHSKFYACRRSVADEAETEDLLHGSPKGIDVGSLAERRIYGFDRATL